MAANDAIEVSLLQLLRCSVCLEQVDLLKALSCQHTICLKCAKQLTVRSNRFKCPICNKENPVPNGGFDQLPDSLVTKQIADLIRQRSGTQPAKPDIDVGGESESTATNSEDTLAADGECKLTALSGECEDALEAAPATAAKSFTDSIIGDGASFGFVPARSAHELSQDPESTTSISSPDISPRGKRAKIDSGSTESVNTDKQKNADVSKLRRDLTTAIEFGKNWQREATEMVTLYSHNVEKFSEGTEAMRDAIIAYQTKVNLLCQEKLQGLSKGTCEYKSEIEEALQVVRPNLDKMGDVLKTAPEVIKKLSQRHCPAATISTAQENLTKLEELKAEVCKTRQAENFKSIKEGDSVRLVLLDSDPEEVESFVKGKVTHSSIGIFRQGFTEENEQWFFRKEQQAMVIFPEQHDWTGSAKSLAKSRTEANMPYKGDKVRVRRSVGTPHFGWRGVKGKKSRGILVDIEHKGPKGDLTVTVEFPEAKRWQGLYSELEVVPGCGLEPGDEVWVSRSIPEPSRGWAGVNGSSVGKVKSISGSKGKEEVTVDFPECADWIGLATEIELVREPQKGDNVQVKLSVKKPQLDWGGVTHEDVGQLTDILEENTYGKVAQVKFTKRPPWSCMFSEIEPARYQPPNYDNSSYESDDDNEEGTVDGLALMRMLHMMRMGGMMGGFA